MSLEGAEPLMLFQTTEVEEGSTKVVVSPAAMLKLVQLMTAFPDV
jgi:hypothetical protein